MVTAAILLALAAAGPFQDDKAAEDALDAFKTAYKSTSEADRVAAVNELAKVHHARTLARLASLLSVDGPSVRLAAAKGLSGFADMKKPAAAALAGGLAANAKETTVHAGLYEALGKLEESTSVGTLHRGFDEKETVVAKAAVLASGQVGSAASIDPLIALLAKLEKIQKSASGGGVDFTTSGTGGTAGQNFTVRGDDSPAKRAQELIPAVNKALNEITRESNGSSETWGAWWAKNKATFKPFK
ncbi:MAG TPA: HEAT repeat domain-containing protein [Planctomycetota bacterium]|nr:HEAT repeat domain-containing protein [Planctomycetota bacterium]